MSHNRPSAGSGDSNNSDNRACRYECPADFVPLQYSSNEKSVLERGENTELWLIKAPTRFNPSRLTDMKVSLSGMEMIQSTDASVQVYSVLANRSGPTDLRLLTSCGKKQNDTPCVSGFAGILSISESYGDCSGNQNPIPVPAPPAPSFPPGLKQRFQPFGSSVPAHVFQSATSTSLLSPKKAKLEPEDSEGQSRKKKKKKEKHSKQESVEVAHIKQEEITYELQVLEPVQEDGTAERKKKKKIKKEKESRDAKQEPMEVSFGFPESSVKKKKKKKKAQDK